MEEGTVWKSRRALFGEDFRETYELLQNRFLFVEGGNDEYLFLEHYVLLGNFMNDPDRFAVFEALLLDFVREIVSDEDDAEELGKARKMHERLLEQARLLRSELARIEREHDEVAARMGEADDRFTQIFRLRGAGVRRKGQGDLDDLRRKSASLEKKLAELAPEIDAAKQRMEFLADEHKSRLGDYLNQPANARRLFDASGAVDEDDVAPETRQRLAGRMGAPAGRARPRLSRAGGLRNPQNPRRVLPAHPFAAAEKGAGEPRRSQARGADSGAVSGAQRFR